MLIIRQHRIYRKDIQANPNILYIFGDNLDREGMGGQAGEMRGEPNSFGIATKRGIGHGYPQDYFFDDQEDVVGIIDKEFERLSNLIILGNHGYQAIVTPMDGIGTGLSRLPETAPKLLAYIDRKLDFITLINTGV